MSLLFVSAWLIIVGYLIWSFLNYLKLKRSATFLDNTAFQKRLPGAQLIDIRSGESFRRGHIVGARHFPMAQFQQSLSALRRDRPVLIYDSRQNTNLPRALTLLKKAGYHQIYVLKNGFDYWDGKVK